MTSLALLLLVRGEGESYGAAGLVVAVYAVALGIGAPIGGRQVDRYGPTVVLQIRVVLFAAFLAAVIGSPSSARASPQSPSPPRSRACPCRRSRPPSGSSGPGSPATSSARRRTRSRRRCRRSTSSAARSSRRRSPRSSRSQRVAGPAVASLIGTTMVARLPPVRETPPSRAVGAGLVGALGSAGVRTVVSYATDRRASPSERSSWRCRRWRRSTARGSSAASRSRASPRGASSGGLLAGLRPGRSDLRRFIAGAFVLSGALLTLQLAVSIPTLCLLAFVAGLPIAPTIGALYTLIDRTARAGTVAEAFAWFGTAISVGIAAGSAVGGVLVDERGVRWSFGLGAAVALVGAVLGWARRGTLRGPAASESR